MPRSGHEVSVLHVGGVFLKVYSSYRSVCGTQTCRLWWTLAVAFQGSMIKAPSLHLGPPAGLGKLIQSATLGWSVYMTLGS